MSDEKDIWGEAAASVGSVVLSQITSLANLAKDDVGAGGMARDVAGYIIEGTKTGDAEMVKQAKALVPVLLETYRISGARAVNASIESAIGVVADTAFALLGQFIPKIPKLAPPSSG